MVKEDDFSDRIRGGGAARGTPPGKPENGIPGSSVKRETDLVTENREHISGDLSALRERVRNLENRRSLYSDMEKSIQGSTEKYRVIFENTGTATLILNGDFTIAMVNNEFLELTGYTREEVMERASWIDFVAEGDRNIASRYHTMLRVPNVTVPRNYECRVIKRSGEKRTCFMTTALIPETDQSIVSFMDITNTLRANEALKHSEEKFSKAFRATPDGILIATLNDGCFKDVNDAFLEMTGYDREETVGHTISELKLWPDARYQRSLMRTLLKEGRLNNQEVTFPTKNGDMRVGMMSAEIVDLEGEACMLAAMVDITDQVRLEKEILNIGDRERRKIGTDLHDDLGQHLIGIEALSSLLHHRLEEKDNPESYLSEEIASLVKEAIKKTKALAKGLCPVNLEEGGLRAALRDFTVHVNKVFGIHCVLDCDRDLAINDDSVNTHLYHIVQEAVNNGIRHGRARQIVIALKRQGGLLTLRVRDNGVGIPESMDRSKGMGLNTMEYRARRLGGTLEVRRKSEGGTEVVCILNRRF